MIPSSKLDRFFNSFLKKILSVPAYFTQGPGESHARNQKAALSIWPYHSFPQMSSLQHTESHVSPSKYINFHYSIPSSRIFPFAIAAATAALSSPSLALTLMQSMGSMLLNSASRIAANAARPRYECRISVNECKLAMNISYKGL